MLRGDHWHGQPVIVGEDFAPTRLDVLRRLNERRHWLETSFQRPLVLIVPANYGLQAAAAGPDLWSMRGMAWALNAIDGHTTDSNPGPLQRELLSSHQGVSQGQIAGEFSVFVQQQLDAWQHRRKTNRRRGERLPHQFYARSHQAIVLLV